MLPTPDDARRPLVPAPILIVDDRPANLVALEALLAPLGEPVVRAHSGEEALKHLLQGEFACVLMDVQMPGMDGWETARLIKMREKTRATPILLLSAERREEAHVTRGYLHGAVDYLVKPLDPEVVRAKASLFVELFRRARELARREAAVGARELEESRAQLREREERLRLATESTGLGTWDFDPATGELVWDARCRALFGLPPGAPVDFPTFLAGVHPEDRPRLEAATQAALAGEGRGALQLEYRTLAPRDGRERWVDTRGQCSFDAQGRPVRFTGIMLDVTDRRRREDELRQRAELEQQLIGIVSHDLRNPVQAILMSAAALLQRGGLDERTAQTAARMKGAAERAARLITELLDFTQARLGGGIRVSPSAHSLHALARGVVDEVRAAWPGRVVEHAQEGDASGEWDGERIGQVVQNLVTNALKYGPDDEPVHVLTRGTSDDGVELSVHNGGAPIPPELLPRLFQALQRGDDESSTGGRSVGLGLYIVDQVVRAHGGRIEVHSTQADGTTFRVLLPRRAPEPQQDVARAG